MATIYDTLRLLAAFGWKQRFRIGHHRGLTHPDRPAVVLTLSGELADPLPEEALAKILSLAGLDEEAR